MEDSSHDVDEVFEGQGCFFVQNGTVKDLLLVQLDVMLEVELVDETQDFTSPELEEGVYVLQEGGSVNEGVR